MAKLVRRGTLSILLSGFLVLSTVLTATPAVAGASQHQGGAAYVYWNMEGPGNDLWNVDQTMWVEKKAGNTFWALQFTLAGAAANGYMGLQTSAIRPDGTMGEMGIFSLWNANSFRNGNGTCAVFGWEGDGLSCRMNFTIKTGVKYRFRIWRLDADANGQWWGAWIYSSATGTDYHLGDLRIGSRTLGTPANFTEYWGPQVGCSQVPQSVVNWTQPAANSGTNSSYEHYSSFSTSGKGPCLDHLLVNSKNYGWTQGVRVEAGAAA